MKEKEFWNWVFELGQLKRINHEGWKLLGIKYPESVAEHNLRAAQIAFFLAKMENYSNPFEVCTLVIFHELEECRIGDIQKVARRYLKGFYEENAVKEQLEKLGEIGGEILSLWKKTKESNSKAALIAKDADLLEMAATAKELMEKGYVYAKDWIRNISLKIKTKSGKKLIKKLKKANSNEWWQGIKKID